MNKRVGGRESRERQKKRKKGRETERKIGREKERVRDIFLSLF